MPPYTPYTAEEYAPDAPATADHFRRWFQNCEAIAAGEPGAPWVMFAALGRLEAGAEIRVRDDAARSVVSAGSATFADVLQQGFIQTGTIRLSVNHKMVIKNSGASWTQIEVIRRRNRVDTVLQTWSSTLTTDTARQIDVSILPGDGLICRHSVAPNSTGETSLLRLSTNGQNLWPGVISAIEGNTGV